MASSSEPKIYVLKADGAIAKGTVVKFGSDNQHVAASSAASDKHVAVAQVATTAAGDNIELAYPGGGGKGLAGGTISAGDILTSDGSGKLVATTSNADRYIAVAMESAVSGDLFAIEVMVGIV